MDEESLIVMIGIAKALVKVGALEVDTLKRELDRLPPLSPHILKAAKISMEETLVKYGYKSPTILQKLGLKKS